MMKLLLLAFNFAIFTTVAVLNAFQDKWLLAALFSASALCWLIAGMMNYKTLKMRSS